MTQIVKAKGFSSHELSSVFFNLQVKMEVYNKQSDKWLWVEFWHIISKQWSAAEKLNRKTKKNFFPCDNVGKLLSLWIPRTFFLFKHFPAFQLMWLMVYVNVIEFLISRNCSRVRTKKCWRKVSNFHRIEFQLNEEPFLLKLNACNSRESDEAWRNPAVPINHHQLETTMETLLILHNFTGN